MKIQYQFKTAKERPIVLGSRVTVKDEWWRKIRKSGGSLPIPDKKTLVNRGLKVVDNSYDVNSEEKPEGSNIFIPKGFK